MSVQRSFRRLNDRRNRPAAHKLVAETAKELAHAAYELLMNDNHFWKEWQELNPSLSGEELEAAWVAPRWKWFLEQARSSLGEMLATNIDYALKETIFEALSLDASLLSNSPVQNRTVATGSVLKH